MKKVKGFFSVVVFVLALFVLIRWLEKISVFAPSHKIYTNPGEVGCAYEEVHFTSDGLTLNGWFLPGETDHTVLWVHGNAGNIADRVDMLAAMTRELKVSSFIFDFRGYGMSEGRPSEEGLYRDTASAFRWLTEQRGIKPGDVILYGHSLGSALTVDLSLDVGSSAGGIVLESPFTSVADMARALYGGLPIHLFLSMKLDNIGRVAGLDMPLLVIHGDSDHVVPFKMGKRVYDAAAEPKRFLPVPGADHNDCYVVGGDLYWDAWRVLLAELPQS